VTVELNEVHLKFSDKWLDEHPLTQADLEQESKYLAVAGFTLKFS
jgi:hypothetical protein